MTKIKHPHLIADIEPNIALANAITIEREQSFPTVPSDHSVHRDARIARAIYLRQLFARAFRILTSGGLDDLAGPSAKAGPKSA